jgi:hypothetical protein
LLALLAPLAALSALLALAVLLASLLALIAALLALLSLLALVAHELAGLGVTLLGLRGALAAPASGFLRQPPLVSSLSLLAVPLLSSSAVLLAHDIHDVPAWESCRRSACGR